jgi:ANTAR domain-containing protein
MTITSSSTAPAGSPVASAPTFTTSAVSTAPDPIALISQVAAEIVRSSDPEAVFGSLAGAYARATGAHCTVELLMGTTVRRIQAPEGLDDSKQSALSPVARQLLAGNGAPLQGADLLALPIGAATCPGTSADIPIGVFTCRFGGGLASSDHLGSARYLIGVATEVLDTESRLAKAQTQVVNLEIALASNRDIGTAIGILMNSHLVTQDEAFTMLRLTSQHTHRKLREVANDVIFTGALVPLPSRSRA